MNHSLNCTMFNRGTPVSKSSWNLGETESDRYTFLGELETGKEHYLIISPKFIWINTNSPVDLITTFKDGSPPITLTGVMAYANSYTDDCQVLIKTRDTTDNELNRVDVHSMSIAHNARKLLNEELD